MIAVSLVLVVSHSSLGIGLGIAPFWTPGFLIFAKAKRAFAQTPTTTAWFIMYPQHLCQMIVVPRILVSFLPYSHDSYHIDYTIILLVVVVVVAVAKGVGVGVGVGAGGVVVVLLVVALSLLLVRLSVLLLLLLLLCLLWLLLMSLLLS